MCVNVGVGVGMDVCVCVSVCVCCQNGWTSFILASANGHLELVKLLLYKGANVNQTSKVSVSILEATAICIHTHTHTHKTVCIYPPHHPEEGGYAP